MLRSLIIVGVNFYRRNRVHSIITESRVKELAVVHSRQLHEKIPAPGASLVWRSGDCGR